MGIQKVLECGNFKGCPTEKGMNYSMCNWTPDESKFTPLIPHGQYMVEMTALYNNEEIMVVNCYADVVPLTPL
ncbi:hypothetical protein ILUMI_03740 [Ignelater luminosus]|uniref:Uncharacterized protein n=1 Tax=Ignelater luminosus TaxID=2038154 RepID=A0A8K0DF82_IGNLU|nr:hypothetical protein ILUMI_03740 [Ignelater luminosus]